MDSDRLTDWVALFSRRVMAPLTMVALVIYVLYVIYRLVT